MSILKPVPPTTVEGQRGRLLLAVFIGMVGIFLANGVVPGAIEKFEDPISQKRAYLATVSVLLVASVLAAVVARRHSAVLAGLVGTALFLGSFNLTRPHDLTEAQPSLALASGLLFAVCLPGSRRVQTARLAGIAIAYFYLTLAVRHGWGSSVARDWISLGLAGAASVVPAMFQSGDRTNLEPNSVSTTNSSRGRTSATQ